MTRAQLLKTLLAAAHLLLVVCGAAHRLPLPGGSRAGDALLLYGEYSGSNNGYGYFAPSVASGWDASFSIYDGTGPGRTEPARWPGANREVNLRLTTILGYFGQDAYREPLAASWAARLFARDPEARLINVHVRAHDLPTMAEVRRGRRPEWVTVAVYPFVHGDLDLEEEE